MKFTLPAIVVATATQLMGIDAAAPEGLCNKKAFLIDKNETHVYTNLKWQDIAKYEEAFTFCLLRDYFSKCLTDQFHQRVSEAEFVKQSYEGNPPTIGDGDLVLSGGSTPARCTDARGIIEMDLNVDYSGQTSYNPFTGQYGGSGRRNRLLYQIEEFGISALNQEALQDFDDKCGNYEVSELFVHIRNLSSSALSISHNVCVCYRFSMN